MPFFLTPEVNIGGYLVDREVASHIKEASVSTGVSLTYLLAKAGQESAFSTSATASKTSATGIYQFTTETWYELLKKHGHKYGYKEYADKISYNVRRGRYYVKNYTDKKNILRLRKNSKISALLAAEYARSNQDYIETNLRRPASLTDIYLAHFMGPIGAVSLLQARKKNPHQSAASMFPYAARANKRVFYNKNGTPRSVDELYNFMHMLFDRAVRKFTNIPPEVFIKIPRVIPASKPSDAIFPRFLIAIPTSSISYEAAVSDGIALPAFLFSVDRRDIAEAVNLDLMDTESIEEIDIIADIGINLDNKINKDISSETSSLTKERLNIASLSAYDVDYSEIRENFISSIDNVEFSSYKVADNNEDMATEIIDSTEDNKKNNVDKDQYNKEQIAASLDEIYSKNNTEKDSVKVALKKE